MQMVAVSRLLAYPAMSSEFVIVKILKGRFSVLLPPSGMRSWAGYVRVNSIEPNHLVQAPDIGAPTRVRIGRKPKLSGGPAIAARRIRACQEDPRPLRPAR